jgi:ABC-type amino acid transport substrate-binding protein
MQSIKAIENNSQDIAIMDKSIATVFKKQNKNLSYFKFPNTEIGCRILFKKNFQLINEINNAIDILIENKKMKQIEEKWFDKN